eukprot:CAMPEP_0185793124 /NCGR_PEP_ID=MMETSP1174-20130828/159303_1 /TAXON_ID=35687 /ORGANISM="Dictyocha speculum, Strain CCMP1381" /LENGTH=44 /DNA_ID= /DNA_START= /DNA_END= /DNA_ORIENTATION=
MAISQMAAGVGSSRSCGGWPPSSAAVAAVAKACSGAIAGARIRA